MVVGLGGCRWRRPSGTSVSSYSRRVTQGPSITRCAAAEVASTAVLCGTMIDTAQGVIIGLLVSLCGSRRGDPQVPFGDRQRAGDVDFFARVDEIRLLAADQADPPVVRSRT